MATKHIDLNCDMGESYGRWTLGADEEIMPWITSANVACGFQGGDPHVMRQRGGLAPHVRDAPVEAARDVRRRDPGHDLLVGAEGPPYVALAHGAVEIDV